MDNASSLDWFVSALRDSDTPVAPSVVEELADEYPFFTLPAMLLLKREGGRLDPQLRQRLNAMLALNAPDPDTLFRLVDCESERWASFYPSDEEPRKLTTDDAITTFLENYGHSTPEEDALLERLIFNPTPDYATLLAQEVENTPVPSADTDAPGSQDALINAFIAKGLDATGEVDVPESSMPVVTDDDVRNVTGTPLPPPYIPKAKKTVVAQPRVATQSRGDIPKSSLLSESLAKIYIKQCRYDKAYEIIHSLSLNFPEKSIYFADQLRFLRKLLLNQQYKQ